MSEFSESDQRKEILRSTKEVSVPVIRYSTPIVFLSGYGIYATELYLLLLILYGALVLSLLALCCGIAKLYTDYHQLKNLTSVTLLEHEALSNREQ